MSFLSPIILPSGIFTTLSDFKNFEKNRGGAVVTKSYTFLPRKGNPPPVVARFSSGFINSVGLRNVGIEKAIDEIKKFQTELSIPVIVSLFDTRVDYFLRMVEMIFSLAPKFIELNLSCPNVEGEFGKLLASQASSTYEVVKAVKKRVGKKIKVIAKLTPNVLDIKEIAKAAEAGGADAISAINTLGPGMLIDINSYRPLIGAKMGGVSGPAIFPVALRCVYEIYQTVKIPIIGIGGITSWQEAVAMFLVGAQLIGVGSAIYLRGMSVVSEITQGIENYLKEKGFSKIEQIIGLAHQH